MALDEICEATLTGDEFAALLAYHGIEVPQSSSYAHDAERDVTAAARQALREKKLASRAYESILSSLAMDRPSCFIEKIGLDYIQDSHLFISDADGGLAKSLWISKTPGGEYYLAFPLDLSGTVRRVLEPLELATAAPSLLADWTLSINGFTGLAAAVDFVRVVFAASLIERSGVPGIGINRSDLVQQIHDGLNSNDQRALITLCHTLWPTAIPVDPQHLTDGLYELEMNGLIAPFGEELDRWLASPALLELAMNLLSPVPGVRIRKKIAPGEESQQEIVLLRGATIWELSPAFDRDPSTFQIRSVDGLTAIADIVEFLRPHGGRAQDAIEPAAVTNAAFDETANSSAETSKLLEVTNDVLAQDLKGTVNLCPKCVQVVRANARFCTKCGAALQT